MTKETTRVILSGILALVAITVAASKSFAQFTPILSNDSYWSDGKAEFDIYDALLMRNGQPRHCEVLHILLRERVDPKTFARVPDSRPDVLTVIRMSQIWTAPIGMFIEQGSIAGYWRVDAMILSRLTFAGTDSFGNIARRVERTNDGNSVSLNLASDTYVQGITTATIAPPPDAVFYDELPMRVRTIDWMKPPAEFTIQLAPTLAQAKQIDFTPAKVSWKPIEKSFEILVQHGGGTDRFLVSHDFPFLLREWQMADGSRLRMRQGLKADYWNYNKNGDRERAAKNPMLQHPD